MSYPVPPPPSGYPQAPPAQPQYQAVQWSPPAPTTTAPIHQQPVPSDKLPGWGQIMASGVKYLSTTDMVEGQRYDALIITVHPPRHRSNPETKELMYFSDGNPQVAYPLTLFIPALAGKEGPEDDGQRRLSVQSGAINVIKTALSVHRLESPEQGGQLSFALMVKGGPGHKAKSHQWWFEYTPATPQTAERAKQLAAGPSTTGAPVSSPPPAAPVAQPPVAPPPPAPAAPSLPPEYAAAGWTAEQYAAQFGQPAAPPVAPEPVVQAPPPPAAPAGASAPSPWPYGQPQQPTAPLPTPPGVPAPPAGPNWG